MNIGRKIPSIFLYAILIAVIWAAWYAFNTLDKSEGVQVGENELREFSEKLSGETVFLVNSRENALNELELSSGIDPSASGYDPLNGPDALANFQAAMNSADDALTSDIGITEFPSLAEGFPANETLGRTLDEADRLYEEWLDVRTGNALRISMDSIMQASGTSILKSGYRRLIETLNRDLIGYRTLDSLQIHDEKKTLYQSELDNIVNRNISSRAEVRNLVSDSNVQADAGYDTLVDELFDQFVDDWTGDENDYSGPGDDSRVLDDIRARLRGFSPISIAGGPQIERPPVPGISGLAWLAGEMDSARRFSETSGGN